MPKITFEVYVECGKIQSTALLVDREFDEELRKQESFSRGVGGMSLEELLTRNIKDVLRLR